MSKYYKDCQDCLGASFGDCDDCVTKVSEEDYEWCYDCKEYDKEKHCCPRWNKVIRQTVAEIREQSSKVGEWKRHPIPENRAWDICTACGTGCRRRHYGFNEDGTEWVEEANYPFCPNCGAKMKG